MEGGRSRERGRALKEDALKGSEKQCLLNQCYSIDKYSLFSMCLKHCSYNILQFLNIFAPLGKFIVSFTRFLHDFY